MVKGLFSHTKARRRAPWGRLKDAMGKNYTQKKTRAIIQTEAAAQD
jgi:hypothetical protein